MKKLLAFCFLILLSGCVEKDKIPDNIMSKQEMVDFLIDLHIVEARISLARFPNDSIKLFFPEIEDSLYRKHQVTDSLYKKSYQYYLQHISLMEEIYSAVVDSLSLRERIHSSQ
ncbi:MAG: DUF4296 domain-containing protein [Cyclobacteriaceae bacterium]|nr:DUF4296 domain-containing protein [Cyclobacteriaceae bacterium]